MPNSVYTKLTDDEKIKKESDRRKRYRERNREKISDARKLYHAENRERLSEKARKYYESNRDRMKAQAKAYYDKHRQLRSEQKKQYRKLNRDKISQQKRRYYDQNREVIVERLNKYSKTHTEVIRGCGRRAQSKRRAVKRRVTIGDSKSIAMWEQQWRSKRTVVCHWCRKRVKTVDVHVDHVIPLAKGGEHTVENLCVACESCNLSKNAKSPEVWNKSLEQPLLFM